MRCIKCGTEHTMSKICSTCMKKWTEMRVSAYQFLMEKYGKLTPENHSQFKKEMKKLERVWRKDNDKFKELINNETDTNI